MEESKDLSLYIRAVTDRFRPTDDEDSATHKFTTKEVTDAINSLNPGCGATLQDTCEALSEAGFIFKSPKGASGINFKWLMVEK
jgi:hypothetical protein